MFIYKVTNKITGKIYIGQTAKNLKWRKNKHIETSKYSSTHFHNALKKYGADNFRWQIICICPDIDSLNEREQYYIALYDSIKSGYNLTSGGKNCIMSENAKQKLRGLFTGENNPNYGKCGNKAPNYNKFTKRTPEQNELNRQQALDYWQKVRDGIIIRPKLPQGKAGIKRRADLRKKRFLDNRTKGSFKNRKEAFYGT